MRVKAQSDKAHFDKKLAEEKEVINACQLTVDQLKEEFTVCYIILFSIVVVSQTRLTSIAMDSEGRAVLCTCRKSEKGG